MMRTASIILATVAAMAGAGPAQASFLSGETLDKAADVMAVVVIIIVPVIAISIFWLVHILPEKVAEQREHPQKDAIKVLCLLSLVFGGFLWPFAWLLAYSKPVLYKMAYGKDKHDDYYKHLAETDAPDAELLGADVSQLRSKLDTLAARGRLPEELRDIRERLAVIEQRVVATRASEGAG